MSSVSQIIPNFIGGINDQPDELKKPGQVRDAVNVIPDPVKGLYKRPGYDSVRVDTQLGGDTFFTMYSEDPDGTDRRFVVYVHGDGRIWIWDADTGQQMPLMRSKDYSSLDLSKPLDVSDLASYDYTYGSGSQVNFAYLNNDNYPSSPKHAEGQIKCATKNDTMWILNNRKPVLMSSANVITKRPFEAFVEVTSIDETRAYPINIDFINLNLGDGVPRSRNVVTKMALTGQINFGDYDKGENQGDCSALTGIYNIESLPEPSRPNATPISIRVEIRANPVVDNKVTRCRYYVYDMTILNGGTGWKKRDVVKFKVKDNPYDSNNHAYVKYEVTQIIKQNESIDISPPAAILDGDNNSVDIIVDQWYDSLRATGRFSAVEKVGNGIYLANTQEPFIVDTTEKDIINILSSTAELDQDADNNNATVHELYPCPLATVNNAADLPLECKAGFICKVANTYSDDDDYYVRFVNNYGYDGSNGQGYWAEIAKPGEQVTLNPTSMPHVLKRGVMQGGSYNPNIFVIGSVAWKERTCGTAEDFNPSFSEFSKKLSNIFFFRNRLVLLSDDNVTTSRAGSYTDFFPATAITTSPSDPIDISADSIYSSPLRAGIVVNNAAVIFSEYQQFLLTTDSDAFTPNTAKMTQISSFHFDPRSEPFLLDTNVGFKGGHKDSARLYEMTNIFREGQVDAVERSKLVYNTLENYTNHYKLDVSRDTGTVFMGGVGDDTLFVYKYFKENSQKDLMSAWVKWKLPGKLVHHFTSRDRHYLIARDEVDGFIDILRLDPSNPPIDYASNPELSKHVVATVKLPELYVTKSEQGAYRADTTASTTIHRLKLNTGETNYYVADIARHGKEQFRVEFEQTIMDGYSADEQPYTGYITSTGTDIKQREETIQLYERNTNLDITLTSTIGPFQLSSMRWEGDYNNRYYQRV